MNEERGTLETVAYHLAGAMEPLRRAVTDEQAFAALMLRLGWQTAGLPSAYGSLGAAIATVIQAVEQLSDEPGADEVLELLGKVRNAFDAIQNISTAPPGVDAPAFLAEIGERLFEILLTDYLAAQLPAAANLLSVLNVIEVENVEPTAGRPGYVRTRFKWQEVPKILSEPHALPERVYGWGTPDLDFKRLVQHLSELFFALRFPVLIGRAEELLADAFHESQVSRADESFSLKVPFYYITIGGRNVEAAFVLLELKGDGATLPGIIVQPLIPHEFPFTLHLAPDIDLEVRAGTDLSSQFGILIRPGEVAVKYPFQTGGTPPSANVGIGFHFRPTAPSLLIGSPGASRLQLQAFSAEFGTSFNNGQLEVVLGVELKDLALILAAGEGDGFLRDVLGDREVRIDVSLAIDVSSRSGVHLRGSGGLEVALNPHISLGPVSITSLTIRLFVPNDPKPKATLELGAGISGTLGPLTFVVEGIGFRVNATFEKGNVGPLDIGLGFKPPNGVGLSLDAGAVKGGGYLYFDSDREEYAGALELVFSEWIALKAIGMITTKMPDGSKGFSLLIIITVEFGTGFQLGFGFTLNGVGGILGLNRIVNIDPLKEGVRSGAIESVMFPKDVVANAPRIISDLRQFFPPQQDIFLVGPMAKLGWGTPTLVTAQLGVILEFPSVNITILGVIKVVLPDEKADILRLQVNFIGRFEPANKLLWFYAELYDSRVLFITLEGGFGLLVHWGDNANFVVSAGGFHPRYSPPPLPFPEPPRIAVSILNESYAKIRIEAYFAVTSNSVQFGARAELFFGLSEFRIEGHLAFDALFQFDPFFFSFGLSVSLSVKVFGVGLFSVGFSGLLEGPTPWYIEGKGRISLLFFKISVPFKHSWGDNEDTKLDPIEVFPLLETEFAALTNWEARLAGNHKLHVSLRKLGEADTDQLVLHPVGRLRISQRKVPINFKLDKVGNKRPSDVNRISVAAALPGSALSVSTVQDQFAIGQYRDLDGSAQLSSPGYEPLDSGIDIGVSGAPLKSSRAVRRVIRYESIIIDNNFKRHVKTFFSFFAHGYAVLNDFLFTHFLNGNAVSQSVHSHHYRKRMQPFDEVIEIQPTLYSVVSTTDNQPIDATATSFTSQAKAHEHMEQQIGAGSAKAGSLHVVPNTELNQAA